MSDQDFQFIELVDMDAFVKGVGRKTVAVAAADVRRIARQRVRLDTTRLRNSIRIDIPADPNEREVIAATPYAAAQEYGLDPFGVRSRIADPASPKSGPGGPYTYNPFMRPAAAEAGRPEQIAKYIANVVRAVFMRTRKR